MQLVFQLNTKTGLIILISKLWDAKAILKQI